MNIRGSGCKTFIFLSHFPVSRAHTHVASAIKRLRALAHYGILSLERAFSRSVERHEFNERLAAIW